MNDVQRDVCARLEALGIPYAAAEHEPVHTIEDCAVAERLLGARMPKNLFLTPRNQSAFYLLIVRGEAEFRTTDISKQIGSSRLSFAPADKLMELMRTLPGAISPMGLLFDAEHRIRLLMDRALRDEPALVFHPCVNTASLRLTNAAFFERFLPTLGYRPEWVDIHDFKAEKA